jgi:MoaA/NifB/PqqE/SkfB family radical SAM enzyme
MPPNVFDRLGYSPFVAEIAITRRCNLSCRYCSEYEKVGEPVPVELLERRLEKLRRLGTLRVSLTGGEPTLHPSLCRLIERCRELGFVRTGLVTNGFLLRPDVIDELNQAGLQEMQLSVDGVFANETTHKVLNNLMKRLEWLHQWARFSVTLSPLIGACSLGEALEVIDYARETGLRPRVLFLHDDRGRLDLAPDDLHALKRFVRRLPRTSMGFSRYHRRLIRTGSSPFKCRAGSRYLYVDEFGQVARCWPTRGLWSKPLSDYGPQDLQEQFYTYKPCHAACALSSVRRASGLDGWRSQLQPHPLAAGSAAL